MEESSSFFSHHREKQIKNGKREREKQGSKPTSTVDDRGTLVPLPPPAFPCPPMAWTMQASRCRTISRDFMPRSAKVEASGTPVQRAAPRRHASQFVAVSRRRFRRRRTSVAVEAEAAATSSTSGDTLDLDLPPRLSLSIGEPCFSVSLTYDAAGGPLDGASRVVARVGVAAWQWTRDVELAREREEEEEEEERIGETGGEGGSGGNGGSEAKESPKQQRWSGFVSVPASRLPAPGHLDLQAAFFAPRGAFSDGSEERWDNAGGTNWGAEVFLFYVFFFFFASRKNKKLTFLSLSPPRSTKKKKKKTSKASPPTSRRSAETTPSSSKIASRASPARRPRRSPRGPPRACSCASTPWLLPATTTSSSPRARPRCSALWPGRGTALCCRRTSGAGRGRTTPRWPLSSRGRRASGFRILRARVLLLRAETTTTGRSTSCTWLPRQRPLRKWEGSRTWSALFPGPTSPAGRTSSWCCPSTTAGTTGRCRSCASSGGSLFPGVVAAAEMGQRNEASRRRSGARSARGSRHTSSSPSSRSLLTPLPSRRPSGAGRPTEPPTTPSASSSSPSPRSSFCCGQGGPRTQSTATTGSPLPCRCCSRQEGTAGSAPRLSGAGSGFSVWEEEETAAATKAAKGEGFPLLRRRATDRSRRPGPS